MNVYDRLRQDHAELRDLFAMIDQPAELQTFGRAELLADIRLKLVAHDKAEEATYYDAIDTPGDLHGLVEDGRHDHQEVARLLDQVGRVPPNHVAWLETMRDIRTKFLKHVAEEENEMFPLSTVVLDAGAADSVGTAFQERELRLLMEERRRSV